MLGTKKMPVRTCVVCRTQRDKQELLRIVKSPEGEIKVDPSGRANGRGAYVCRQDSCVAGIENNKILQWAFKIDASTIDKDKLRHEIECALSRDDRR